MTELLPALVAAGPIGVVAALLVVVNGFMGLWIRRLYTDMRTDKAKHEDALERTTEIVLKLTASVHDSIDRLERLETIRTVRGRS